MRSNKLSFASMSLMTEPDDPEEITASEESEQRFTPRWAGSNGEFNESDALSRGANERVHYLKHAVVGREWQREMSRAEYSTLATQHLNNIDSEKVIELCQGEDLVVVKYNLDTGELGIARRDDGLTKTFFRPNDVHYVLRKVDAGLWGDPGIAEGFESTAQMADFSDDPQKLHLLERLEALALELPSQAHAVVAEFGEGTTSGIGLLLMLARLGEYRFAIFELQRRIMTEAQNDAVFALRRKIIGAVATIEGLERYRSQELIESIKFGLDEGLENQERLWGQETELITDLDEFESSLTDRESLGYAILELRVLQLHQRILGLELVSYEHRLSKCDIKLRGVFYQLATRFNHKGVRQVSPESFFWRRMAENIS